jgi:hypothetical protein
MCEISSFIDLPRLLLATGSVLSGLGEEKH